MLHAGVRAQLEKLSKEHSALLVQRREHEAQIAALGLALQQLKGFVDANSRMLQSPMTVKGGGGAGGAGGSSSSASTPRKWLLRAGPAGGRRASSASASTASSRATSPNPSSAPASRLASPTASSAVAETKATSTSTNSASSSPSKPDAGPSIAEADHSNDKESNEKPPGNDFDASASASAQ